MQPSIASVVGLKGREVGEAPLALVPTKKKLTLMRHAASVDLGSLRTSEAAQKSRDIVPRQRRVGDLGGHGGSEDQSWKRQTYQPFAR